METGTVIGGPIGEIDGSLGVLLERVTQMEKDDEWPLVLLASPERAEVRRLAELRLQSIAILGEYRTLKDVADYIASHPPSEGAPDADKKQWKQLLLVSRKLPMESDLREELNKIVASLREWHKTVLDRGRQNTQMAQELASVADGLKGKHEMVSKVQDVLLEREADVGRRETAVAEAVGRLRRDHESLQSVEDALAAEKARLQEWSRELDERDQVLRDITEAQKDAAAWWEDLRRRVAAAQPSSARPWRGMDWKHEPVPEEVEALVAAADRLVRQRLALPAEVGVGRLKGIYTKGLQVTRFGSWPIPHIELRRRLGFVGHADIATLKEVHLRFGRVYLGWPQGVPIGRVALAAAVETGHWPLPLAALKAFAAPALVAPGVTPLDVDSASITFSARGWPDPLSLPRDLFEELRSVLASEREPVAALRAAGILGDPLLAELVKASMERVEDVVTDEDEAVTASAPMSPLARCLMALRDSHGEWKGTPSALVNALLHSAQALGVSAAQLPATGSALSRQLRRGSLPSGLSLRWGRTRRARWLHLMTDEST